MISAILLAGGSGTRMGKDVDKLMLEIEGKPLLIHALLAFQECIDVDEIILVARQDRKERYWHLANQYEITKLLTVTEGGIERQDSVWAGLGKVNPKSSLVLIHDGARSLIVPELISRCVAAARLSGAAIPAMRVKDTIKEANIHASPPSIASTLDRSRLWAAQTPQTFRTDLIRRAYEPLVRAREIVTDDAAAVERLGHEVTLVEADALNLKITTPEDLLLAEIILSKRKTTR